MATHRPGTPRASKSSAQLADDRASWPTTVPSTSDLSTVCASDHSFANLEERSSVAYSSHAQSSTSIENVVVATRCSICNSKFGDLMNRRHHCRVCGESVCRACSPNLIELYGESVRVCTPCVHGGAGAIEVLAGLQDLCEKLQSLQGCTGDSSSFCFDSSPFPLVVLAESFALVDLALQQAAAAGPAVVVNSGALDLGDIVHHTIHSKKSSVQSSVRTSANNSFRMLPIKRCQPAVQPFAEWQINTSNCGICNAALGKRRFRPRHHCRVCGKCVCAKCASNFVRLPHAQGTHRACNLCVGIVHKSESGERGLGQTAWIVSKGTITHQV